MLKLYFYEDVMHITDDKQRLTSLTIYNGCPEIHMHHITDEDVERLLDGLLERKKKKKLCSTCGQKIE